MQTDVSAYGNVFMKLEHCNVLYNEYELFCGGFQEAQQVVPVVMLTVVGSLMLLFLPSVGFMLREDWSYSTALYFSFISLSTIGFGDYVAGKLIYAVKTNAPLAPHLLYPLYFIAFYTLFSVI